MTCYPMLCTVSRWAILSVQVSREDEHYSGCLVYATALANAAIALGPHRGGKAVAVLLQAARDRGLPGILAVKVSIMLNILSKCAWFLETFQNNPTSHIDYKAAIYSWGGHVLMK